MEKFTHTLSNLSKCWKQDLTKLNLPKLQGKTQFLPDSFPQKEIYIGLIIQRQQYSDGRKQYLLVKQNKFADFGIPKEKLDREIYPDININELRQISYKNNEEVEQQLQKLNNLKMQLFQNLSKNDWHVYFDSIYPEFYRNTGILNQKTVLYYVCHLLENQQQIEMGDNLEWKSIDVVSLKPLRIMEQQMLYA